MVSKIRSLSRILVVEDAPAMRQWVRVELEQFGDAVVSEAANVAQAVRALNENNFSIVVLELGLPMDDNDTNASPEHGLALLKHIKAEHPNMKVVVFTSYELDELAIGCGADLVITKASLTSLPKSILSNNH